MLSWVSSWWTNKSLSGPARNAPNDGKNIKELLQQKPVSIPLLSQQEISNARNNLKKITPNKPYESEPGQLKIALTQVFAQGNETYFNNFRKRREQSKSIYPNIGSVTVTVEDQNFEKLI